MYRSQPVDEFTFIHTLLVILQKIFVYTNVCEKKESGASAGLALCKLPVDIYCENQSVSRKLRNEAILHTDDSTPTVFGDILEILCYIVCISNSLRCYTFLCYTDLKQVIGPNYLTSFSYLVGNFERPKFVFESIRIGLKRTQFNFQLDRITTF